MGVKIVEQWDLGTDLAEVVRQADAWQRLGCAVPDYCDAALLAQLHSNIGNDPSETLPRIDQIPAYKKLDLGQLSPRRSIQVLDQAQKEINELRQLLSNAS